MENNSKVKKLPYKYSGNCVGSIAHDENGVCLIIDANNVLRFAADNSVYLDEIYSRIVVPLNRWKIENALIDWM